jgi:hypothetical protein
MSITNDHSIFVRSSSSQRMFASLARTTAKVAVRSSSVFTPVVTMPKRFAAQQVAKYVPLGL